MYRAPLTVGRPEFQVAATQTRYADAVTVPARRDIGFQGPLSRWKIRWPHRDARHDLRPLEVHDT